MAHWLWLSSTAWLKVPSSSRSREDPIERGKLRSVNLLQRTRARPDSIHVWADRGRDHPEEFISQPHRWPYFFHHNGPVSHRHRQRQGKWQAVSAQENKITGTERQVH